MIASIERMRATVHGNVQRVSFRYFTMQAAKSLNVKGWVRNRFDRSVEVLAEGNRESLELLLARIQEGPKMSKVGNIDIQWENATGEFRNFKIRMTR